MARLVNSS